MERKVIISELMESSNVKFGTSGARGLVADMSDYVCYAYTLGFIQYLKNDWLQHNSGYKLEQMAIAGDLRPSTPRIMAAVARAVADSGMEVINSGFVPSPAVALYGISNKIPAVMVTGSHIPADRNGIKYNTGAGEILKEDEIGIKAQEVIIPDIFDPQGMLAAGDSALGDPESGARVLYIDRWLQAFPVDFLNGMTIGVYQHSAVGRDIMNLVVSRMGGVVVPLQRSDEFIPVDTEAIRPEDITLARETAAQYTLDAIISTDGDSDRPLVSDEKGNWLRGDIAGVLTAEFLGADCVVTPVSSNTAVELCEKFEVVKRTRIGSPFVIAGLNELYNGDSSKVIVGYEANGGFLQRSPVCIDGHTLAPLPTRDPMIVQLSVLGLARRLGVPISELVKRLPARYGGSDRLQGVPTEISSAKLEGLLAGGSSKIAELLPELGEVAATDTTDGIRIKFVSGDIMHFRPSGNAPELRCYVEAGSQERAEYLLHYGIGVLDTWLVD